MANQSLIDIKTYFKRYNGAPDFDKFSSRPDYAKKDPETEEEMLIKKYAAKSNSERLVTSPEK